MMKRSIRLEDLDCANCAAKLERAIAQIDGVTRVSVSFMAQKILLEVQDEKADEVLESIKRVAKKTVPDCTVIL